MTGRRVHGVGGGLVPADEPPVTVDQLGPVLHRYGLEVRTVDWLSARPLSAGALVTTDAGQVFVKRHSAEVRSPAALSEEHAFIEHLRARDFPTPAVLLDLTGSSAAGDSTWTWELFAPAVGLDLYRDVESWQPFASPDHAYAAGRSLVALSRAAQDFERPQRTPRMLLSSWALLCTTDFAAGLDAFVAARPMLAAALAGRSWQHDLSSVIQPLHRKFASYAGDLPSSWTHGDGHASNFFWTNDGDVASVIDFGLSDRTTPLVDLATALERNTISWLAPDTTARLDLVDALLDGWESVLPLSAAEGAALASLLPVVHVEFALSELAYFHGITGSAADAQVAYETYLLGHARWHRSAPGRSLRRHLTRRFGGG